MRYRAAFTVVYSKKTGRILREVWEPLRRLCWPFPWRKLPGEPEFSSFDDLSVWFDRYYPEYDLRYDYYGKSRCED